MRLLHSPKGLSLLTGLFLHIVSFSQDGSTMAGLKQKLAGLQQQPKGKNDTAYINALTDLAYMYSSSDPDSALLILAGNIERCQALKYKKGEADTYLVTGDAYMAKGMYEKALQSFETTYRLAEENNFQNVSSAVLNRIGTVYLNRSNYPEALTNFYKSLKSAEASGNNELTMATLNNIAAVQYYQNKFNEAEGTYMRWLSIARQVKDTNGMSNAYNNIGEVNLKQKNPAKALSNLTIAYNMALQIHDKEMVLNTTLSMAEAYYETDSLQKAALLFEEGLQLAKQTDHGLLISNALIGLAKVYYKQTRLKEALDKGLEGLQKAQAMGQVQLMRDANEIVSSVYEAMNDGSKALVYYKAYKLLSDSMNNLESQRAVTIERDKYNFSKKESEFDRKTIQQRWLTFSAFAGLLLLAFILWIIIRNRNRIRHTYKELQQKNVVIETEKSKVEKTLSQLRDTQAQLIQSEKMASLGELTAGIAHEIQNPLNFVNNFSELNKELLTEMKEEIEKGNYAEVKLMAGDLAANEQKINHHGRRADAIVKSMLQHSGKNTGQKEFADINALCDEYLRLAYLGIRAKDKLFNANLVTDFDKSIGTISIVPQDMGRVILNIFNNAFYAVNEKQKLSVDSSYHPMVSLSTKKQNDSIIITVSDNGNGIAPGIIGKIFQPFFTTKPTGQGTGLGLSLIYDIITQKHNGTIGAESEEGEGTTFIITLPA